MSLTGVRMTEEVWLACLGHALTTEKEEIMGLLLGDIHHADGGSVTAFIWGASPQVRSDRRKDRVETNPEQLAAASAQAEHMMTVRTGRPTRVIGWYHSHPHITVMPSHVDVRTQAMYQLLDLGFVGLIFSCFNEDTQKIGKIQVIAFQSLDGRQQHAPIINKTSVIEVESSWSSSENALSTSGSTLIESLDKDTADSRLAKASKVLGESSVVEFSHADGNFVGRDKTSLGSLIPYDASSNNIAVEMDSMDMTASMQEALHRSNMDMSGAEYVRKEIPLQVLPNWALFKLDSPLSSFKDVQHVLFEEERSAYKQALLHNMRDGNMHPLAFVHHTSTYQASLCKLMEYCLIPAINALQDRLKENEVRLAMLLEEAKSLEPEVLLGREIKMTADSQRRSTDAYGSRINKAISPRDSPPSSDSTGLRSHSGIYGRSRKAS